MEHLAGTKADEKIKIGFEEKRIAHHQLDDADGEKEKDEHLCRLSARGPKRPAHQQQQQEQQDQTYNVTVCAEKIQWQEMGIVDAMFP